MLKPGNLGVSLPKYRVVMGASLVGDEVGTYSDAGLEKIPRYRDVDGANL